MTILDKILVETRRTIEKDRRDISDAQLEDKIKDLPPCRDFRASLAAGTEVRLIAEVKRASPSAGLIREDFEETFAKYDAIVGPTSSSFAPKLGEYTDPMDFYLADIYMAPANVAGLCAISVPCGFGEVDGVKLPAGLHIMGKQFDELTILQLAHAFESR